MSDGQDDAVGRGRPPKHAQFKKGRSGNAAGRPRKNRRLPVPSQIARDVLKVRELPVSIKTPHGEKIVTLSQAAIYSLGKRALTDKVSFMKEWLKLEESALQWLFEDHRELQLGELLQKIVDETAPCRDQLTEETIDGMVSKWKKLL